jgi:hypothetical protein
MGPLDDQPYRSALGEGRKIIRDLLEWTLKQQRLDALIGPTIRPARLISEEAIPESRGWRDLGSLAGWPEVVVPAGDTTEPKLPVGISFLGPAFSESRLLALGHAFERGYPMRRPSRRRRPCRVSVSSTDKPHGHPVVRSGVRGPPLVICHVVCLILLVRGRSGEYHGGAHD